MEAPGGNSCAVVRVVISVLVVCVPVVGVAVGPSELWERGVEYYRARQYDSAYWAFSALVERGYYSCALFKNLGNTAWQLQRVGEARLWWERAYRLCPLDEELYNNILLAVRSVGDSPPYGSRSGLVRVVFAVVYLFENWRGWLVVGGVGWVLFWLLLYVFVVRGVRRVWVLLLMVFVGVVVVWSVVGSLFVRSRLSVCNRAVNVESVVLYAEPVDRAEPLTSVPPGYLFGVEERTSEGWLKVHTRGGLRGWVAPGTVVPLSLRGC